jgi:hypothetical protein
MTLKSRLLKERIRAKLRRHKSVWESKKIDFRKLKGHPQRYQPSVVSITFAGVTPDDVKHYTEEGLQEAGQFLGKTVFGYSAKRSDKENLLYHNLRWLLHREHPKFHKKDKFYQAERWIDKNLVTPSRPHSSLAKTMKFLNKFEKTPLLDTPLQKIRKRVWNLRVKGV